MFLKKDKAIKIHLFPSFSETGGTFTYLKTLLNFLKKKKNVKIIVFLPVQYKDTQKESWITSLGIKIAYYNCPKPLYSKYLGSRICGIISLIFCYIYFYSIQIFCPPQVIIQSTGNDLTIPFFLLPFKVIAIQHSLVLHQQAKILSIILNKRLNKRRQLLTVSKFAKDALITSYAIKQNKHQFCKYIHNGHESIGITNYHLKSKQITITTIGHISKHKNPMFWEKIALEITRKYSNVHFIWAGDGPLLYQYKNSNKSNIQIRFLGHQNNIEKIYKNSDIYFQPSLLESHGIAVIGAMAAKIPCVVANVGGMPESVTHNKTGFVYESNNLDEAIYYIEQLCQSKELRQQLGNNGYERYQQFFTPEVWEQKMNNYLKENFNV